MRQTWYLVIVVFITLLPQCINGESYHCENATVDGSSLFDYMLGKEPRPPWKRPVANELEPIEVKIFMGIVAITEVNERNQQIRMNSIFHLRWHDQFRIWNNTYPFACVKELTISYEKAMLWTPDVVLWNSQEVFFISSSNGPQNIRLDKAGGSLMYPGGEFTFSCPFDLTYFPFDIQNCNIVILSWTSDITQQILSVYNTGYAIYGTASNEQWTIANVINQPFTEAYDDERVYSQVIFTITLARKPGYYMMNIFLPSITISLAEAITFLVPADSEDRLAMSFAALLGYSMFQTLIYNEVPKSADHPPLLTIYLSFMNLYIFAAITMQGFIIHMINSKQCFKTVQRIVSFHHLTKLSNDDCEMIELRKHSHLTSLLNRSATFVYLFLAIVTPLSAFAIVPYYSK